MNILVLTQYYPPETGAPQNRLSELAIRFVRAGDRVEVLTAMPNYPFMEIFQAYRHRRYVKETIDGVTVHRSSIFVRKGASVFIRLLSYFSFVCSSLFTGLRRLQRFDLIICESPPLFLGITAWILKKAMGAQLLFNVSDLWPESAEKLGLVNNRVFLRAARSLEEFLYRHSDLISGQTQGIIRNISTRFPEKNYFWLKNGVDPSIWHPGISGADWRKEMGFAATDKVLFYGGILGHAQGLGVMLKAAQLLQNHPGYRFVLAGDGPCREELQQQASQMELNNLFFVSAYPKSRMPEVIAGIDAAVIPLRKLDLFLGAIPSKIFESLAMKKPILLGVEGEARTLFIEEGRCGLPFIPEDASSLADAIRQLTTNPDLYATLAENGYLYVTQQFNRDKIFTDFQRFLDEHLDN